MNEINIHATESKGNNFLYAHTLEVPPSARVTRLVDLFCSSSSSRSLPYCPYVLFFFFNPWEV